MLKVSHPTAEWLAWLKSISLLDDGDDCWIWPGAVNGSGYGVVRIKHDGASSPEMVHRAAWAAANHSPIPDGYDVDHTCGTPLCGNPDHLQALTKAAHAALEVARRAAYRPKPKPPQVKPYGTIRERPRMKRGVVVGTTYAVLYRVRDEDTGVSRQTSQSFRTRREAKAFLATLARVRPYRRAA